MTKDIDRIIFAMALFGIGYLVGLWVHDVEYKRDCAQIVKVKT